jgi:hypothetical protein
MATSHDVRLFPGNCFWNIKNIIINKVISKLNLKVALLKVANQSNLKIFQMYFRRLKWRRIYEFAV